MLGRIYSAGGLDCCPNQGCSPGQTRLQRPQPGASGAVAGRSGMVCFEILQDASELERQPFQFRRRKHGGQTLARAVTLMYNRCPEPPQRHRGVLTVFRQLLDEEDENIQLAHAPELSRHLSETATEFPSQIPVQLQKREQFAKSS